MPKIPGINHLRAIKALEKAGFKVVRQACGDEWTARILLPFHAIIR